MLSGRRMCLCRFRVIFVRSTRTRRPRHVRFAPIASEPSHRRESTRWYLAFFESIPEVRVLPSTGITRLQRSYYPVRLPADAAARSDVEAAALAPNGSPPITRTTFPACRAHYPGGSSGGIRIVTFEACSGFTHVTARRIAQPPTGDLCHEAPTHAVTRISRSSATGSIDNSPGGFLLH